MYYYYPMTEKQQRKQFRRDRRTIDRAWEVFERLGLDAVSRGALDLALEQIKGNPTGTQQSPYPVTDKRCCKQKERDRRAIECTIELVTRTGMSQDRGVLEKARKTIDEEAKAAGLIETDD